MSNFIMTDLLILRYRGELETGGICICSRNKEMQPKEIMQRKPCIKGQLKFKHSIIRKSQIVVFLSTLIELPHA